MSGHCLCFCLLYVRGLCNALAAFLTVNLQLQGEPTDLAPYLLEGEFVLLIVPMNFSLLFYVFHS